MVAAARCFASTLPYQSCWKRGRSATVGGSTGRAIVYLRVIAQVSLLKRYRDGVFWSSLPLKQNLYCTVFLNPAKTLYMG
jgi:hypothetical protein